MERVLKLIKSEKEKITKFRKELFYSKMMLDRLEKKIKEINEHHDTIKRISPAEFSKGVGAILDYRTSDTKKTKQKKDKANKRCVLLCNLEFNGIKYNTYGKTIEFLTKNDKEVFIEFNNHLMFIPKKLVILL